MNLSVKECSVFTNQIFVLKMSDCQSKMGKKTVRINFASLWSPHNPLQFRLMQKTVSFAGQNLDIRLTWDCGPAG